MFSNHSQTSGTTIRLVHLFVEWKFFPHSFCISILGGNFVQLAKQLSLLNEILEKELKDHIPHQRGTPV